MQRAVRDAIPTGLGGTRYPRINDATRRGRCRSAPSRSPRWPLASVPALLQAEIEARAVVQLESHSACLSSHTLASYSILNGSGPVSVQNPLVDPNVRKARQNPRLAASFVAS